MWYSGMIFSVPTMSVSLSLYAQDKGKNLQAFGHRRKGKVCEHHVALLPCCLLTEMQGLSSANETSTAV